MATQDDNHVKKVSPSTDPETTASSINQVNVLQEWDDENDELIAPNSKEKNQDYFASVQDALNEINREAFGPKEEEDAIETMLKDLLLGNNGSAPKDLLYDNMLSKLLGRELLYAPLLDLHNEYPKWLAEHIKQCPSPSCQLVGSEKCRFESQYFYLGELMALWDEKQPSSDEAESNIEDKGIDMLIQIQDCGCPPDELIRNIGGDPTLFNMNTSDNLSADFQSQGCSLM